MAVLVEPVADGPRGTHNVAARATRVLHGVKANDAALSHEPIVVHAGPLNVIACGSVDDGKSTLIGRMLWDADALTTDQRAAIERAARTAAGTPDFSRLVDGLAAEREQGITIDIAWRYFDTPKRRLVIIDSPGHEQYTRNMATGASHADIAILLVDARSGMKVQTRRHAAILDLMGVRHVVLAVNKMDLVDWSESRFRAIEGEFLALADRFGFRDAAAIPVSAVLGDGIARRSKNMVWYAGLPLLDHLHEVSGRQGAEDASGSFRFPVQMVVRAGQDFRGLAGTVTSGAIARGEEVVDVVSGRRTRVRRIVTMGHDLDRAGAGQAVVLQLDTDIDVSRGAVLAAPGAAPVAVRSFAARLVWLSDQPFERGRGYLVRMATDLVPVASLDISRHLDLTTLAERPALTCSANDIAVARIELGRATVVEAFANQRETGSLMLVDAVTGASVAGGVVVETHAAAPKPAGDTFRLTRSLIKHGVGADLGDDAASEEELRRRANEVAILLRGAGVTVELDDRWGHAGFDASSLWFGVMAVLSFGCAAAIAIGLI
ncbi:MAG: sulfate adenylyltransferase [Hyphomicrobiaceae bacterium]|nr:sulfate adenylyltransferase [Hyphomicrobiaceae bacterium]